MSVLKIKDSVYWVGVKNPELRVFDVIMKTDTGTTYNSYLIDDEKVVVVDTVKDGFFDEFLKNIKEVIGERKVDYIVVNHTEPDHSGSLNMLLETYPEAIVVGSKAALINSRQIINRNFNSLEAKEPLNIGKRTLNFIAAPFLHWPDTIFTYLANDKMLFTCDFLGCHHSGKGFYNNEVGNLDKDFKYYFDVIMSPFKKYILSAIDKIKDLDYDVLAPSHGPIHRENIERYIEQYKEWSLPVLKCPEDKYAVVLYVSAYGYTETIANAIASGMKEANVRVDVLDISKNEIPYLVEKIERAKAIAVGSPTVNQDVLLPVWDLLAYVSPFANRGKIAVAFGSYGWSGEAVPMLAERLKSLKLNVAETFKVQFKPTEADIERAKEIGVEIGKQI